MSLINSNYQQQLQNLHNIGKFNNGHKSYQIIENFMHLYKPTSVLDFGCGQGGLISTISQLHKNVYVEGYDPGTEQFSKFPTRTFDAVVSTDAIEHIEPEFLTDTLTSVGQLLERCGCFRIACYPAKKMLQDGRNAHLIVETPEWWREKILSTMPVLITKEKITVVDKSEKWPWVIGHNYDLIVERK